MDPQAAGELVEAWLLAPGQRLAGGARQHGPVSRAVRALARDSGLTGIAHSDRGPAMLVLADGGLLVLDAEDAGDDAPPAVAARRLQLDPGAAEIALVERYEREARRLVRVREWRLRAGGHELLLHGRELVSGGPREELGRPDANETLARAVAEALGWRLP